MRRRLNIVNEPIDDWLEPGTNSRLSVLLRERFWVLQKFNATDVTPRSVLRGVASIELNNNMAQKQECQTRKIVIRGVYLVHADMKYIGTIVGKKDYFHESLNFTELLTCYGMYSHFGAVLRQ